MCDTIQFSCSAKDPDHDSLTYNWYSFKLSDNSDPNQFKIIKTDYNGQFLEQGAKVRWKPGALKGNYLILLKVTDIAGYEEVKDVIINVEHNLCDNIQMVFTVSEIEKKSIDEYAQLFDIVPSKIVLANYHDFEFEGMVYFNSSGWRDIHNFNSKLNRKKAFYTDFPDRYVADRMVVFTDIEISLDRMVGNWVLSCSTCDGAVQSFVAMRE